MNEKPKRTAIYLRVSTEAQNTDNQLLGLQEMASVAGWEIVGTYIDHAVSGAKGRDQRPEFDRLCKDAAKRKFNVVLAWSVDRLGRSLQDLVAFLNEMNALKIDICIRQQGMDTTTPSGKAMFQMVGVFAEFEREIIRERVNAGLARAKAQGKRLGRPPIENSLKHAVLKEHKKGTSMRNIANKHGLSVGGIHKIIKNGLTFA